MKKIAVLLLCVICVLTSACSHNNIYFDNAAITKSADQYSAVNFIGNTNEKDYSLAGTMTGVQTIWHYDAESNTEVTILYLLSVPQGGKAKLVLVTPDNKVITLSENTDNTVNTEMQSQTIPLEQGNNRIRIVGYDNPEFKLNFQTDIGQLGVE